MPQYQDDDEAYKLGPFGGKPTFHPCALPERIHISHLLEQNRGKGYHQIIKAMKQFTHLHTLAGFLHGTNISKSKGKEVPRNLRLHPRVSALVDSILMYVEIVRDEEGCFKD